MGFRKNVNQEIERAYELLKKAEELLIPVEKSSNDARVIGALRDIKEARIEIEMANQKINKVRQAFIKNLQ